MRKEIIVCDLCKNDCKGVYHSVSFESFTLPPTKSAPIVETELCTNCKDAIQTFICERASSFKKT